MSEQKNKLEEAANEVGKRSLISELFGLLAQTKKWWMLPIIIVILLLGLLIILGGTGAAPFIYTLF